MCRRRRGSARTSLPLSGVHGRFVRLVRPMETYTLRPRPDRPAVRYKIDYAGELNQAQHEAATTLEGPVLVIAGAGSGKTRTLVYRVARLVESGVSPANVLPSRSRGRPPRRCWGARPRWWARAASGSREGRSTPSRTPYSAGSGARSVSSPTSRSSTAPTPRTSSPCCAAARAWTARSGDFRGRTRSSRS
jgi:hypothetical protein